VISHANERFWAAFRDLPKRVQRSARQAYRLFQRDPFHPSLQFKQIHPTRPIFSARVGLGYRAVALRDREDVVWFWVGTHAEYERLVSKLRRG
jgi:hypothetical protein